MSQEIVCGLVIGASGCQSKKYFRFSLRTAMLGITLVAIYLGAWQYRANRHEVSTKALEARGVLFGDGFEDPIGPNFLYSIKSPIPANGYFPSWFADNFCVVGNYSASVECLYLAVDEWRMFAKVANLQKLEIVNCELTADTLASIAGCKSLRALSIHSSALKASSIAELGSLKQLNILAISDDKLLDQDIVMLRKLLPHCKIEFQR